MQSLRTISQVKRKGGTLPPLVRAGPTETIRTGNETGALQKAL